MPGKVQHGSSALTVPVHKDMQHTATSSYYLAKLYTLYNCSVTHWVYCLLVSKRKIYSAIPVHVKQAS